MNKTKIEWCDYTWNPVTGCLHDCPYCYARGIARRFGCSESYVQKHLGKFTLEHSEYVLEKPDCAYPNYPLAFRPTLYKYRLDDPQRIKKPSTVFVCSMADLFGEWVPDEWIQKVFAACEKAPQHRYLFLTKNAMRYAEIIKRCLIPNDINVRLGVTITSQNMIKKARYYRPLFLSIEPISELIDLTFDDRWKASWVIIGAETGNRRNKVIPKREWIENIIDTCRDKEVPVFMKNNLRSVWGEELIQQFPWGSK